MEHSNRLSIEGRDKQLPSFAERVYKAHFGFLKEALETFVPPEAWNEVKVSYARRIRVEGYEWSNGKYTHLGVYGVLFQVLLSRTDLLEYLDLPFERGYLLWLRDRYDLSPRDLGAAVRCSEGTVRTRILQSRKTTLERLRSLEPIELNFSRKSNKTTHHYCIQSQEIVENWTPVISATGPLRTNFSVDLPAVVAESLDSNTGSCEGCVNYAEARARGYIYAQKRQNLNLTSDRSQIGTAEFEANQADSESDFPIRAILEKKEHSLSLNWEAAPWYLKIIIEGFLATSLIVGVVLAVPRIKSLYEYWLEKRFDLYSITEVASNLSSELVDVAQTISEEKPSESEIYGPADPPTTDSLAVVARTRKELPSSKPTQEKIAIQAETEFGGGESLATASSKIFRVFLKTDSPESLSENVLQILSKVEHKAADDAIPLGSQIPGGVLIDVYVPVKNYTSIINEVTKLGDSKLIITSAKGKLVPGKARIRIWIQRI
ncbi:MAG TPA: hypothetical protein PLH57_08765 [Oligoflexia bacterium]|nr:hypothetical protein [Oligoflexia bacterium]